MAKIDNLDDFLKDIANTIREKKGTNAPINAQNFSSEIASIASGGVAPILLPKDVNFRDYDGTILYAFSKDEFLALEALPKLPTQSGLICQEWNWDLEEAQAYVQKYGILEIGATYITDDGKTRLYISIEQQKNTEVILLFKQSVANSVVVDWGDGTQETNDITSFYSRTHTYQQAGDYIITLDVTKGGTLTLGYNSEVYSVMGNAGYDYNLFYCCRLRKVEIGAHVTIVDRGTFRNCYKLTSVTIPNSVTSVGNYAFHTCRDLSHICVPRNATTLGDNVFQYCTRLSSVSLSNNLTKVSEYHTFDGCYALERITLPSKITRIVDYCFGNCQSLTQVVIPDSVTSINSYAFYVCKGLPSINLPNGITKITNSLFYQCLSLDAIVVPNSVTTIENYAIYACKILILIDFRTFTAVPTLSATTALQNIPEDCKIVVPDDLYDEWIAATNWSTYASYIIKASEFNG